MTVSGGAHPSVAAGAAELTDHPDGSPRRAGPEPVSARYRCGRLTNAGSDSRRRRPGRRRCASPPARAEPVSPSGSNGPSSDASGDPDVVPASTVLAPLAASPQRGSGATLVARTRAAAEPSAPHLDGALTESGAAGAQRTRADRPEPTERPDSGPASASPAGSRAAATVARASALTASKLEGAGPDVASPTPVGSPTDEIAPTDQSAPLTLGDGRSRAAATVVARARSASLVSTSDGDVAATATEGTTDDEPGSAAPGDGERARIANAIVGRTSPSRLASGPERDRTSSSTAVSREAEQALPEVIPLASGDGRPSPSPATGLPSDDDQPEPTVRAPGVARDPTRASAAEPKPRPGPGNTTTAVARARSRQVAPTPERDPAYRPRSEMTHAGGSPTHVPQSPADAPRPAWEPRAGTAVARALPTRASVPDSSGAVTAVARSATATATAPSPDTYPTEAGPRNATYSPVSRPGFEPGVARHPFGGDGATAAAPACRRARPQSGHWPLPSSPSRPNPRRCRKRRLRSPRATMEEFATAAFATPAPRAPPARLPRRPPAKLQRLSSRLQPSSRSAATRQAVPTTHRAPSQLAVARETSPAEPEPRLTPQPPRSTHPHCCSPHGAPISAPARAASPNRPGHWRRHRRAVRRAPRAAPPGAAARTRALGKPVRAVRLPWL